MIISGGYFFGFPVDSGFVCLVFDSHSHTLSFSSSISTPSASLPFSIPFAFNPQTHFPSSLFSLPPWLLLFLSSSPSPSPPSFSSLTPESPASTPAAPGRTLTPPSTAAAMPPEPWVSPFSFSSYHIFFWGFFL